MSDKPDLRILEAQFQRAGVPLRLARAGFVGGVRSSDIVQMDIRRTRRRNRVREEVVLWPGKDSDLRVLGCDPGRRQLVLLVHEPERTFVERQQGRGGPRDIVRKTSAERRRFLVGMDERHLFIAPLATRATSVRDAHEQLRPANVTAALQRGERVVRQGEWFFVPPTEAERRAIDLHAMRYGIEHRVRVGPPWLRGRPHVASERLRFESRQVVGRHEVAIQHEFVRGRILHPDHKVVVLKDWMRVEMNTEARGPTQRFSQWVD